MKQKLNFLAENEKIVTLNFRTKSAFETYFYTKISFNVN